LVEDEHGFIKGVDDWRDGFYEPMGYHTGGSGIWLHGPIWGTPALRRHIWGYCPEIKLTLKMDAKKYVPGDCKANWKRDLTLDGGAIAGRSMAGEGPLVERDGVFSVDADGNEVEIIDGKEYPILPGGLTGW
jgi:hypothetical protein